MLTDQQSLILCGLLGCGIFVTGLLDILDNFIVLTVLTLIFLAIMINLIITKKAPEEEETETTEK
jgi:hypothetical protein